MTESLAGLRQQYHFMPDENGRKAWDIYKLIELSAELPIEEVPLDSIKEVESVYWFNDDAYPPTVRAVIEHAELIEAADLRFPIILGADGRVMDGMHRVCKAVIAGHTTITARRFLDEPDPDYRNCSAKDLDYTGR